MSPTQRIQLRVDGERVVWTGAFRGFTPRGHQLAAQLKHLVRPQDAPAQTPSLTRWVARQLEELDDPRLEIESVRVGPADADVPEGAVA